MASVSEYAFPFTETAETDRVAPGLTKRELFAAMAMQGLLAASIGTEDGSSVLLYSGDGLSFNYHKAPERIATMAAQLADALLAELNKPR